MSVVWAHEGYHPRPHPAHSPDYHEINASGYASVETKPASLSGAELSDTRSSRESLMALVIELIAQKLAELGRGGTTDLDKSPVNIETNQPSATTGDRDIVSGRGNLEIEVTDNYRYFTSNSLPTYTITGGRYPHPETAQDIELRTVRFPRMNDAPTYYHIPWTFGIAINGVLFEPFAAEWYKDIRNGNWQEDPFVTLRDLDISNAHVQPSGLYHYHGLPTQLMQEHDVNEHSPVIGYASDGFPVYYLYVYQNPADTESAIIAAESSWVLKTGNRDQEDPLGPGGVYDGTYNEDYEYHETRSSLDECNGRYGPTPEYPDGTYYYVLTKEFPYIPRCLMGDPDSSFSKR